MDFLDGLVQMIKTIKWFIIR